MDQQNSKISFIQDGDRISLELECRLGSAPGMLQNLIKQAILPLAQKYDPEGLKLYQALSNPDEDDIPY